MSTEPATVFSLFTFTKLHHSFTWARFEHCPFRISFPGVEGGWLEVELTWDGGSHAYSASDLLHSGLDSLLEAVVDILPYVGLYDKYFGHLRTHTRCRHELEPGESVWDLGRTDYSLLVLLRDSPDLEYDQARFFDRKEDWELRLDYPHVTAEKLQQQVLMALEMPQELFVAQLYLACKRLLRETGEEKYEQEWGAPFPHELLRRLEQYILFTFQHQWGFWDYTGKDQALRFQGRVGTPEFTVVGRQMVTVEKLIEKGLW